MHLISWNNDSFIIREFSREIFKEKESKHNCKLDKYLSDWFYLYFEKILFNCSSPKFLKKKKKKKADIA